MPSPAERKGLRSIISLHARSTPMGIDGAVVLVGVAMKAVVPSYLAGKDKSGVIRFGCVIGPPARLKNAPGVSPTS